MSEHESRELAKLQRESDRHFANDTAPALVDTISEVSVIHALRWGRERAGWTRGQAAERLQCHFTFIHRYEAGQNLPKLEFMEQAAAAMGFGSLEEMRLGELPNRIQMASPEQKKAIQNVLTRYRIPKSWTECVKHVRLPGIAVLKAIADVFDAGSVRELLYGRTRASRVAKPLAAPVDAPQS